MRGIELTVLCEGITEQAFVRQVLSPHLRVHNVFARPTTLNLGKSSGQISFKKFKQSVRQVVGKARAHQVFTTMMDLYRLGDFPGGEATPGRLSAGSCSTNCDRTFE